MTTFKERVCDFFAVTFIGCFIALLTTVTIFSLAKAPPTNAVAQTTTVTQPPLPRPRPKRKLVYIIKQPFFPPKPVTPAAPVGRGLIVLPTPAN